MTYVTDRSQSCLPTFLAVREEHDGMDPNDFCQSKGVEILKREQGDGTRLALGELLTLKRVLQNQRFAA